VSKPASTADRSEVLELLRQVQVSAPARTLLQEAESLRTGLERLFTARHDLDAVRALAFALPIRRAVWWGCLCAWHGRAVPAPAARELALDSAVEWVCRPTAEVTQRVLAAAAPAGLDNAAGCVARAAAEVGPSPDARAACQHPAYGSAARIVQGAALYACLERQQVEPAFSYRALAALGMQVARGEVLWER
jgi:hypothetical protein